MSRTLTLLLALVVSASALAGCTRGDDPPASTTPSTTTPSPTVTTPMTTPVTTPQTPPPEPEPTLALNLTAAAPIARPGERVNLTLVVNATGNASLSRVGVQFSDNTTVPTDTDTSPACDNETASAAGTFALWCVFPSVGTWYVWAWAEDGAGNATWVEAPVVVEVMNFTLTLTGAPTTQQGSGSEFSFVLNITGSHNVTSDHIGAHYFQDATSISEANAAGDCQHVNATAVGDHTLTCSITHTGLPQEYHLRGHLRVTQGGVTLSWWSEPVAVTVGPVGLGGLPGP